MINLLGIINLHHDYDFGDLTKNRTFANASYLGRYHFIDFPLSNLTNSGIKTIEILVKEKPASLFKHLNLGAKEWAVNTKTGGINLMYNEFIYDDSKENTDIKNLIENKKYILNRDVDYVVFAPAHVIGNFNYKEIFQNHKKSEKDITVVYKKVCDNNKFKNLDKIVFDKENNFVSFKKDPKLDTAILEIFLINKNKLIEMIDYASTLNTPISLKEVIYYFSNKETTNFFEFKGFARVFTSLENYVEFSIEMLNKEKLSLLFNKQKPIYTRTYDDGPARYGPSADVKVSLIASGSYINGSLKSSIIGRSVVIEEGAYVSNSIIYSNCIIKKGSKIENAIIEKDNIIEGQHIKGTNKKPIYIG